MKSLPMGKEEGLASGKRDKKENIGRQEKRLFARLFKKRFRGRSLVEEPLVGFAERKWSSGGMLKLVCYRSRTRKPN